MIRALDADTWRAILSDVDEPTVDAVAELLAGRFHMDHGHARDELTDATADASTPVATDGDETIVVDVDEPAGETDTDDTADADGDGGDELGSDAGDGDDVETERVAYDTPIGPDAAFIDIFRRAQAIDGREPWAYVTETALRTALEEADFLHLLDAGRLQQNGDWKVADLDESDDPDTHAWRYYYTPAAPDTRPDEFRRFHELLTANTPDGYEPYYFRVERAGKAPATQYGSWKDDTNRLDFDDAVAHMADGGNIGIAGTPDDALVNIDIDDGEATTPDDLPESIRVRSRSRGESFHTWGFDPDDDVPNLPTDELGEVRTTWQYVVVPGSFAASDPSEIPDDAEHAGYYTVEHEATVPTIDYDDLPDAFHEWKDAQEAADAEPPSDVDLDDVTPDAVDHEPGVGHEHDEHAHDDDDDGDTPTGASGVYKIDATDVVEKEGGSAAVSDRWPALFHGSSTSANMSVSQRGKLQCWRHNVAHGGLQALAALSDHSPSNACHAIGTGHTRKDQDTNPNPCRYKGDWRLVWWAWEHAKDAEYIPDDDPIPYRVLLNLAVRDDVVDRDALVERESDDGGTYAGFPDADAYDAALDHVAETYGRDPGRDHADDGPARDNQLIVLPDVDEPDADGDELADTDTDTDALDDVDEPAHGHLTVDYARARTKARLVDAYTGDDDVLLEALPSMGKSYGSVAAAVETGRPATILAGRGNKEQYDRIREWCRDHGLDVGDKREPNGDVYILPSFKRDCETANGDHGEDWADTVGAWYDAGATPKQIHKIGPYALDDDRDALPCQAGDATCGYTRRWDFDPDDFDVLIGHYTHAHKPKVTTDRVVVVDEFTTAYETELAGDELADAVNQYLSEHGVGDGLVTDDRDGGYLPFQTFSDLLLNRDDPDRRAPAVEWLRRRGGVATDEDGAIYFDGDGDTTPNAAAPLAIYTILKSTTLGNGYERVEFRPDVDDDRRIGVFDDGRDRLDGKPGVSILRPPAGFDYADVVVGLDGTPTPAMWELSCGRAFDHRTVLEGRRAEYLTDALGFRILPTTDALKPYNNPDYINTDHDAALLEAIATHHDTKPSVITSATAVGEWDDAGVIDLERDDTGRPTGDVDAGPVDRVRWHGNVLGSNAFGEARVGAVIGSNHYGDGFVKRWGAYAGEAVTRQHADGDADPDTKPRGSDLSYGAYGDEIYRHMTEADTLQAIMRFGRDAGGATVYVDTDTLPAWVPTTGRGDVRAVSDGLVGVLDALADVGPAATAELVEHDAVDVSARQVRTHLGTLEDYGVVASATDPDDGRRTIYGVDDDAGVTATGVVDLPDVDEPTRSRPWSRPTAAYDTGESSGSPAYDRSIYVRLPEDRDDADDVETATTTAGDELESDGDPPETPGETIREVTPAALPDGGVVRFDLTLSTDDEPTVLEYDIKKNDAAGDPWYLTSDGSSTLSRHRRGARPATRRRSRPAPLPDRGGRRGRTPTRGPIDVDPGETGREDTND